MNSFVNVQVRVMAGQALSQLGMIQKSLVGMQGGMTGAAASSNNLGRSLSAMRLDAFGSKIQWVGRQLEYNFTLPIMAATGAAMKMALDNETAMKRMEKVYGDAGHSATEMRAEVDALGRSFVALSNKYGVQQKEVLNVAADWAAAGASGIALAKSVDLTMQTMILGEMKAADATQALIAIQAQYGESVDELSNTIGVLNMVENQTGISLQGLIQGFARAAGVARSGGVDVRHLAAMLAALTPAAGSAAQAGNALKTIFSRLLSPTKEMTQVFHLMGIEFDSQEWKSANLIQQLHIMAQKFQGLSDKQKGVVSSVAASRWQVNRFDVLMRDMLSTTGYYQKALDSTRNAQDVYNQKMKELNTVLGSNPRKLQIMTTVMKNSLSEVILPFIPALVWLATAAAKAGTAFANMNPSVQKLIITALLLLAAVGPVVRITGALILLFGQLMVITRLLLAPFNLLIGVLWTLIRIPVAGFLTTFGAVIQGTVRAAVLGIGTILSGLGGIMSTTLLAAAARAGAAWRAGLGLITTITTGFASVLVILFRRTMFFLEGVMLAGARAMGIAWRAGLMAMSSISSFWSIVVVGGFKRLMMMLGAIIAGGFSAIVGFVRGALPAIRAASSAVMAAMTGPWGLAITAVLVLVVMFWDQLKNAWKVIVQGTINAFNALPAGVRGAFQAVINVIEKAVMYIYELFSWMNPWAHHSPSLVENVTSGMAEIKKQFAGARSVGSIFKDAGMDLESFGKAVERLKRAADLQDIAKQRKDLASVAKDALPEFDKLVRVLFPLKDLLAQIGGQVARQEAVVAAWQSKLDSANAALDRQEKILSNLQKVADGYQDKLNKAQAELDRYANAPIKGMKAMSDAIFNNEMQQKRLRLEMMKMEDAVGPLDKLQGKIDAINGQMELLSGQQADLRAGGAGSEILKYYDQQIGVLDKQKAAIEEQAKPLQQMSDALDELGRKAEMLDLENSLKFDPLKRQIDDAANSMKELPFDQIMAGVISNKAEVDKLTVAYNNAKDAVDAQQAVVDRYKAARDAIQATYDAEQAKLQKLQDAYSGVENKIRDVESALQDMGRAAQTAADLAAKGKKGGKGGGGAGGLSPGAENFMAGAGGNFPDPGGFAKIGREGGWGDQSKMIDEFTKKMQDDLNKSFGSFDMLGPIKNAWNKTWAWVKNAWGGVSSWFKSSFGGLGKGISNPFESLKSWGDTAKNIGKSIMDAGKMIWGAIGPEIIETGKQAWAGLKDAFSDIQPNIEKFRDLVAPMGEALGNLWSILKPVLAVVLGLILLIVKALIGAIAGAIGPFIRAIGDLIAGIIKIIRGIIEFIVGVFTGDWEMAWTGIKDIFSGIWQAIWGVIKNFVNMIWGAIKGFVKAIWDFFVWLWDELVGHSIIPDMVNGIINWFKKLVQMGKDLFNAIVEWIKVKWDLLWYNVRITIQNAKIGLGIIMDAIKKTISDKWEALKNALKAAWEWVWNQIKGKIDWAKGVLNTAVGAIKTVFDNLGKAWKSVVDGIKRWIDDMVSKFNAIKNRFSFSGMFDGIKDAFRNAINWVIGKWNGLNFPGISVGGQQLVPGFGTPDIGYLARGGMIARHAMAVIGEGRKGFPEYVIPTDPMHRRRAMSLYGQLGAELGVAQSSWGGHAEVTANAAAAQPPQPAVVEKSVTNLHFHGNLEFPNIKTVDDADRFIRHLESLAGGGE